MHCLYQSITLPFRLEWSAPCIQTSVCVYRWADLAKPNLWHRLSESLPLNRDQKSTQTFSGQYFTRTLRVIDVRTENHGRPLAKVRVFPAAPLMGRYLSIPWHPGVRVKDVCRKIWTSITYVYGVFLP